MLNNVETINKREAILNSAYRVFTEKGYHTARVSEIAKEAKVGKGTVYEYFSSKEDLLRGVIVEGIKFYMVMLTNSIQSSLSPWEKIKNMIRKHADILREHQKITELVFHHFGIMTPDFQTFLFEQRQVILELLQQLLKAGIKQGEIRAMNIDVGVRMLLGTIIAIQTEQGCLNKSEVEELLQNMELSFLAIG